jgi:hypothetical protein
MDHSEIIRRVGLGRLKTIPGVRSRNVADWRERGIPTRHWHRVVELSASLPEGERITFADLETGYKGTRIVVAEAAE